MRRLPDRVASTHLRLALDIPHHSYDRSRLCDRGGSTSTSSRFRPLPRPSPGGAGCAARTVPATTAVLRITTESGAVGEAYHEWSGPMLADIVDRVLREELVGERADRREWLWHRLWELDRTDEFPIWLIGVVDVALWDLEARVLGVPVHRLLGTYREEIPAYASTTTFATIEEYLDVADQCLELGLSRRSSSTAGATRVRTPSSASGCGRTWGPTST